MMRPYVRSTTSHDKATWLLVIIAAVSTLPFLGCALFYSKGEPREAVVALSMLKCGDWILPVSNGDMIPYKPPMLAWCIASVSAIVGYVSEYTSRLPSALALIGMLAWGMRFMRGRSVAHAFLMGIVTLTSFEVYRAGMACRVDMLLTFFIVAALYELYAYWSDGMRGLPWLGVILMSGAVLTKGPVGVLLPCGVSFIFMLLKGCGVWKAFWRLSVAGLLSLVIPSVWYVAAYMQGGEKFLDLMMEENISRFTGNMSYDSHVKPVWYNFVTLILGYLPYTLLVLMAGVGAMFTRRGNGFRGSKLSERIRDMHSETLFSLVAIVFIFGFYCVPESKRSVYLLPIYPFIAYFIGTMIMKLVNEGSRILRIYTSVLAVLMLVVYAAYICVQCGWVPASVVGHGKHALDNARMLTMLSQQNAWWQWVLVSLPAVIGAMTLLLMGNLRPVAVAAASIIITVTMYWSLSGVLQPGAVNGQSGYELASFLNHYIPDGPIYSYNSDKAMRHFMADFYTGDRIKPIELTHPGSGYMVIGVNDAKEWLPAHSDEYEFYLLHHFKYRVADVRQQVIVLRFAPK